MSLTEELRPMSLDHVYGNKATVEALRSLLERDENSIPHTFLFHGPAGTGKTSMAQILSIELGIPLESSNHVYINASSDRGIASVRKILKEAKYLPLGGGKKFYLFDECHGITGDAQEALLNFLEKPPKHCYIALCTTRPEKLDKTTRSRCTTFRTESLKSQEIVKMILDVVEAFPESAARSIAKRAEGCARDAIRILDQVMDVDDDLLEEAIENASLDTPDEATVKAVMDILLSKQTAGAKKKELSKLFKSKDQKDWESLRRGVLGFLASVLVSRGGSPAIIALGEPFVDNFYDSGKFGFVTACYLAAEVKV